MDFSLSLSLSLSLWLYGLTPALQATALLLAIPTCLKLTKCCTFPFPFLFLLGPQACLFMLSSDTLVFKFLFLNLL